MISALILHTLASYQQPLADQVSSSEKTMFPVQLCMVGIYVGVVLCLCLKGKIHQKEGE